MRVLFVENEDAFRQTWAGILRRWGYDVEECRSQSQVEQLVAQCADEFDIALLDMRMDQDESGLHLINLLAEKWPDVPAVVLTAFGNLDNARKCMEAGAFSYVEKTNAVTMLQVVLERAAERRRLFVRSARMSRRVLELQDEIDRFQDQLGALKAATASVARELGSLSRERKTSVDKREA